MQPGDVIGPGAPTPPETEKPTLEEVSDIVAAESTAPSEQAPSVTSEPDNNEVALAQVGNSPKSPEPSDPAPSGTEPTWQNDDESQQTTVHAPESVSWTASEYLAQDKSALWYVQLAFVIAAIAAVVYLITRDVVSTVVVAVAGAAFGGFAARKPQELDYSLDSNGLKIGPKLYAYGQFKSFTVTQDGPQAIMLMPMQRFMPPISVYYDPADEEKITTALSAYLPFEEHKQDMVENLMRRLRF